MAFWSFWLSGAMLGALPLIHWLVLRRAFGVSGRYTALVDALRFRSEEAPDANLDQAALLEALRAQTAQLLGPDALEDMPSEPAPAQAPVMQTTRAHALFLIALALGGALGAALSGSWTITPDLRSEIFPKVVAALSVPQPVLLLVGGILVGAGTRMAGGCTSGHGLCGVSQLQPGSLLATAAFFGAAVLVSFALGAAL